MNQVHNTTTITFAEAKAIFDTHEATAARVLAHMKALESMTGFGWCAGDITVAGLILCDVGLKALKVRSSVAEGEKNIDPNLAKDEQLALLDQLISFHARSVAKCTAGAEKLLASEWPELDVSDHVSFISRQMDLAAKIQAISRSNPSGASFKLLNIYAPVSEVMAHVVGSAVDLKENSSRYNGYIAQINDILIDQPEGLDLPMETAFCFLYLAFGIAEEAMVECKPLESGVLFDL